MGPVTGRTIEVLHKELARLSIVANDNYDRSDTDRGRARYTTNRRRLMQVAGGLGTAGLLGTGTVGAQQSSGDDNVIRLDAVQQSGGELNYDVDDDGTVSYNDVVALFENFDDPEVRNNVDSYDFNRNDRIDFDDVVTLFEQIDDPPTGGSYVWQGVSPDDIGGLTNPTLSLTAGETYTVEWTNVAGGENNFVIADGDGNEVLSSDTISEQGATQTVEFTATEEMAAYYSSAHPDTQRGSIDVGAGAGPGEVNLLVFSATAGFRHGNIEYGIERMEGLTGRIADETGADSVTIDTIPNDASQFPTDTSALEGYDAIIWFNTTGDVLNSDQQAAFEEYIQNGGGYVGIHAAADTEYDWEFYGDMLGGAYFNGHPSPQEAEINVTDQTHPSTDHLPARWTAFDEWYGYQQNPRGDVHVLAELDETTYDTAGAMNHEGFGRDHPIAWAQHYQGGRAWYTGRGHTEGAFDEENFIAHVLGGIYWAAGFEEDPSNGTIWDSYDTETVVEGLNGPMKMDVGPDGGVLVTQRGGTLKHYDPVAGETSTVLELDVYTGQEDGLQGVAHDPNFAENGWIYLYYSPPSDQIDEALNRLSRFTMEDGSVDPASEVQVFDVPTQRETCCHTGGDVEFDTQGNLFLTTGDDTNPFESSGFTPIDERDGRKNFDAQRTSADTSDLRGSVIRITPQDDGSYTIPDDNLFTAANGYEAEIDAGTVKPEIYGMGFRNPFTAAVNPKTDELWVGDYGPDSGSWNADRGPMGTTEYVNVDDAGFYGWPYFTGKNVPYKHYNFETGESGRIFDPENPTNDSVNNGGLTELPMAEGASIMNPYDWSGYIDGIPAEWEEYVPYTSLEQVPFPQTATGSPIVGTVYEHDPNYGDGSLTAAMDGKIFITNQGGWIKYITLDDDGEVMQVDPFLPDVNWDVAFDMNVAADGSLYVLERGAGSITRVTGGGVSTTASVSFDLDADTLEPGASTTGTATIENISDSDLSNVEFSVLGSDAVTATASSGTSFDSIAPGAIESVEYEIALSEDAQQGSYGLTAEATFDHEGEEKSASASASVTVPITATSAPFGYDAGGTEIDGTVTIDGLTFVGDSPVVEAYGDASASGNDQAVATAITSDPIEGTENDALYQSEQYGGNLSYDIGIQNGTYDVTLHFAETFQTAEGDRVFDVSIQGEKVLKNFDIYAEVGHDTALTKTFENVEVTDETLSITSTTITDNTKFSGIEIRYSEPLRNGLEAYYSLDGDTPTNAVTGNDATIEGDVTTGEDGLVGNAYKFHTNGTIDSVADTVVSEPLPLNGEAVTVGAWINHGAITEDFSRVYHVDEGGNLDSPTNGWNIEFSGTSNTVNQQYWDGGQLGADSQPGVPVPANEWIFVVTVIDGGEVTIYAFDENGQLDGSPGTGNGNRGRSDMASLILMAGDGRDTPGRMDEVWAYSRALSPSAVERLYSQSFEGYTGGNGGGGGGEPTTFELGGQTTGWVGQAPSSIEGTTNPTLEMTAGEEYTVTWENLDGNLHDFHVLDAEGNEIDGTGAPADGYVDTQGETTSVTFTATEEMAEYYCSAHTLQMRGDVNVGT